MKKNILVFPCGSEIGLDIYSSVQYSTYFHLIGGSSVEDHGKFVYEDYISDIPFVNTTDFIPTMAKVVKERRIDAIYPAMDLVITILKEHEGELGCRVISSTLETTRICLSKEKTYNALNGVVRIPKIYDITIPQEEFPVFAKPAVGYGAKGTKKLNCQEDVNVFIKGRDNILLLEYLPGEEYTVDCFTDRHGNLLYSAARRRNRVKDGISVNTSFVEDKHGELSLLEIASRLGGSSLLSRAVGVNFALLSLFDAFDYDVTVFKNNYTVELDRALENKYKTDLQFDAVYCDYDDCLIIDKTKVNVKLVSFLFKCVNDGKKIYLLSKHNGDLFQELIAFRLDHLFDEVMHIEKDADKVNYIKELSAIFIDDSNAERVNVKNKLNLPVFSPEMIDVLI